MSKNKRRLDEGVADFFDKIFYKIINGINDRMVRKIRKDPEMDKKIQDFKNAKENLFDALDDMAEDAKKMDQKTDKNKEGGKKSKDNSSDDGSKSDDEDIPSFLKDLEDDEDDDDFYDDDEDLSWLDRL